MKNFKSILTPILLAAGKIMSEAHLNALKGDVKEKGDDPANMVTVYDVAVQNFLIDEIKKVFPTATFIAEEKENDTTALMEEYCFIIDPIDGTTNFIHDYRHSAISLALFSKGEAIFAAVYDPYQNEMFTATQGEGAFLNDKPISVAARELPYAIIAFGTSPYYKDQLAEKTFRICYRLFMAGSDVRRAGSAALDLAYLAAGRNDAFFECLLSPWDIAAGYLIIKEAGGIITDMEGKPIDFSHSSSVIAASPSVFEQVLNTLKEC